MLSDKQVKEYLKKSVELAEEGAAKGNYPIGSIIVDSTGEVIAEGHNENTTQKDITAHAEITCIRKARLDLSKDKEDETILFTSLEPCYGCSFFIARTNIKLIYSALKDPHKGGVGDLKNEAKFASFFSKIELVTEPFEDLKLRSRDLMKEFFLDKGNTKTAELYS